MSSYTQGTLFMLMAIIIIPGVTACGVFCWGNTPSPLPTGTINNFTTSINLVYFFVCLLFDIYMSVYIINKLIGYFCGRHDGDDQDYKSSTEDVNLGLGAPLIASESPQSSRLHLSFYYCCLNYPDTY